MLILKIAMRIFVTGAAGFIGSNLVDNLLKNGNNILGIDNFDPFYNRSIKENNLNSARKNPNFHFEEGDIRDGKFIDKKMTDFKPDLVVHLAAKAGVRPSLMNPHEYYDVNVTGTLTLLEMMRKHNLKRLVFASSSSVYGNNSKVPFSETDNVDFPISPYAASKKAGELICHTYHHLYNFDIFCLRFFTVYGPRQRPDLAVHKFTEAMLKNEPITLYGDGSSRRDYTYIDDIVHGINNAISNLRGFEIFNLGESRTISLKNLVTEIEKHTGKTAIIKYMPTQEGDVFQTYADIQKAKTLLNYNPQINIEAGIGKYVSEVLKMKY
jgi:UDP-glucuronate 4-epimerase